MTASVQQDFDHYRGDYQRVVFDIDPESATSIQNLTNKTVYWAAYPYIVFDADLDNPILEKDSSSGETTGIVVTSAPNMIVEVVLDNEPDDDAGIYYHKAWVIDADGKKMTVATGRMTLLE